MGTTDCKGPRVNQESQLSLGHEDPKVKREKLAYLGLLGKMAPQDLLGFEGFPDWRDPPGSQARRADTSRSTSQCSQ